MPRYGFSGGKPDMKKLILFVMKSLPDAVAESELASVTLLDDNANYFVFSDALQELCEGGQLLRGHDGRLTLTPEGHNLAYIVEHDVAAALRRAAGGAAAALRERKKRDACVLCRTEQTGDALYFQGELTDGEAPLFALRLLVGSEEQARLLEKAFRKNAEALYQMNLDALTAESK